MQPSSPPYPDQAARAAALLAEIGDCRARFPDAESLTSLAGAAPSTRQVGQAQEGRVPLRL